MSNKLWTKDEERPILDLLVLNRTVTVADMEGIAKDLGTRNRAGVAHRTILMSRELGVPQLCPVGLQYWCRMKDQAPRKSRRVRDGYVRPQKKVPTPPLSNLTPPEVIKSPHKVEVPPVPIQAPEMKDLVAVVSAIDGYIEAKMALWRKESIHISTEATAKAEASLKKANEASDKKDIVICTLRHELEESLALNRKAKILRDAVDTFREGL